MARSASLDGVSVAYDREGDGPAVVLIHGQREYRYQSFHRLDLPEALIDGRPDAVRAYLAHFWSHWSGPGFSLPAEDLERLVEIYAQPGAFLSSIAWYRAGAGTVATSLAEETPEPAQRLATPTSVLWPTHDPLFPPEWGDRLEEHFTQVTVQRLEGVGHFTPLEAAEAFSGAIRAAAAGG